MWLVRLALRRPVTPAQTLQVRGRRSAASLPKSFWDQEPVEKIEAPLHKQREGGSGNGPLQNRGVIVQVQAAQNRLA